MFEYRRFLFGIDTAKYRGVLDQHGYWFKQRHDTQCSTSTLTGRTLQELEDKANSHILNLNMWLIANKLHLNMDKTCYSIFSPSKYPPKPFVISLKINHDIVIKHVSACKYNVC